MSPQFRFFDDVGVVEGGGVSRRFICSSPSAAVSGRLEFLDDGLVGLEERQDEVAIRVVAVAGDERPLQGRLAFGGAKNSSPLAWSSSEFLERISMNRMNGRSWSA